jgi:hypothetical protein
MKNITRRSILSLLGLAPLVGLVACKKDEPPTPLDGLMKEGKVGVDLAKPGSDTTVWYVTWGDGDVRRAPLPPMKWKALS